MKGWEVAVDSSRLQLSSCDYELVVVKQSVDERQSMKLVDRKANLYWSNNWGTLGVVPWI